MKIIKATVKDAPLMKTIIECHAKNNRMLSRSLSYLYDNIRDYSVAVEDGKVVGCCALHISWEDLAEVKSLAVAKDYTGRGIGRALLESALAEAKSMGIPKVFTLTLEPEFFMKHGFTKIPREDLPMKVWGECIHCPKYPDCDETALTYSVE